MLLCYVIMLLLCYNVVMLCYARLLCNVTLYYIMLHYVKLCYISDGRRGVAALYHRNYFQISKGHVIEII